MKTIHSLCLGIFLICSNPLIFSQSLYVSTTGDNNQSGSYEHPLRTLQAAANTATAGTTVYVLGGTYVENVILNTHSGTTANPIVFKNYDQNEVVIDGGGATAQEGEAIMELRDISNIIIEGFTFRNIKNRYVKGLVVYKGCSTITVQDNIFTEIHFSDNPNATVTYSDNASPLLVYATDGAQAVSDITFRNNEIYNCRTGYSEGMSFSGNVDGFLVVENYVHDITNIGIQAEGHFGTCSDPEKDQARNGVIRNNVVHDCVSGVAIAGGIYVDGAKDIVVENNRSYNGQLGISVGCENPGKTASNITVRNNVVYQNSETGIEIGGYDYPNNSGSVVDASVTGNTSYKNDSEGNWIGELWVTYCENLTVQNNIFYADNDHDVVFYYEANNGSGNNLNYNLYFTPTGAGNSTFTFDGVGYDSFSDYVQATNHDVQSKFIGPGFINPNGGDFHLQTTSPAVNGGNPNFEPSPNEKDMDGESRLYETIDCGADELQEALGISNTDTTKKVIAYPNPTQGQLFLSETTIPIQYSLFNMLGAAVRKGTTQNGELDFSTLPNGLYILKLKRDGIDISEAIKIIKK